MQVCIDDPENDYANWMTVPNGPSKNADPKFFVTELLINGSISTKNYFIGFFVSSNGTNS